MEEQLIRIGIAVVFIGVALIVLGGSLAALKSRSKVEWAVGGILGFVPFGFGTNKKLAILAMAVSTIFLLFLVLLKLRGW
jgi:uncharacterized membrane protein